MQYLLSTKFLTEISIYITVVAECDVLTETQPLPCSQKVWMSLLVSFDTEIYRNL